VASSSATVAAGFSAAVLAADCSAVVSTSFLFQLPLVVRQILWPYSKFDLSLNFIPQWVTGFLTGSRGVLCTILPL
jgi:hypothetical protein